MALFDSQLDKLDLLSIDNISPEAKWAYDLIIRDIPREEAWFRKLWNINFPDVKDGYAVLTYENGRFSVETFDA